MSERNILIRCTNIHKVFSLNSDSKSQLQVLRGVNFDVHEGEMISIVGASGSGKSTLLHILGGLDRPSEGKVYWHDNDLFSLDDESLAKLRGSRVGFVFQFHHLLPEFTALENIMIPMMIQKKSETEVTSRAKELLRKVGLSERTNHKPSELSGGEQQRVAVARALANNPSIIFADEPSGNLDSANSQQLHELLFELNRTERQTFVIVTHNEQLANKSHRIFRMMDGQLLQVQ